MAARRLRVLLAENRHSETGIILRSLCAGAGWALEVNFVGARADLAHALATHRPEVALLDLSLLQPDAPAHLRVLHRTCPSVPLILFAEPADEACAVQCLSMGATDFLLEGFMDERTMSRALHSAISPAAASVPTQSSPDSTGHSSMYSPSLPVTRPSPPPCVTSGQLCILCVTVENLDHLQFWMGTLAVDRMLQEMLQVLKKCVRATDRVVSVSQFQLQITLHNVSGSCSSAILQRVRARVESHAPIFLLNPAPVFVVHEGSNVPVAPAFLSLPLPSKPQAEGSPAALPVTS